MLKEMKIIRKCAKHQGKNAGNLVVVVVEGEFVLGREGGQVGGDVPDPQLEPPLALDTAVFLLNLKKRYINVQKVYLFPL